MDEMNPIYTNVREWYINTYPEDTLGQDINPDITFEDLVSAMENGQDVYNVMGVGDSIVRENIFYGGIAPAYNVDDDSVYNLWLYGTSWR